MNSSYLMANKLYLNSFILIFYIYTLSTIKEKSEIPQEAASEFYAYKLQTNKTATVF